MGATVLLQSKCICQLQLHEFRPAANSATGLPPGSGTAEQAKALRASIFDDRTHLKGGSGSRMPSAALLQLCLHLGCRPLGRLSLLHRLLQPPLYFIPCPAAHATYCEACQLYSADCGNISLLQSLLQPSFCLCGPAARSYYIMCKISRVAESHANLALRPLKQLLLGTPVWMGCQHASFKLPAACDTFSQHARSGSLVGILDTGICLRGALQGCPLPGSGSIGSLLGTDS